MPASRGFATPFGRDAIITALETCWLQPQLSRDTLRFLANTQATECNTAAASEPGKIIHEMRDGEMAELGRSRFDVITAPSMRHRCF